VHPCATLALCHARQQALVVRPRLRGRSRRPRPRPRPHRPAVPPRCTRALSPASGPTPRGGSVTSPSSRPALLFATRRVFATRPGRWRRDQCMKMEDDGSCAHEMDPRTRGAPRPGPPGRRRQTVTAAAALSRRQTHTRQVSASSALRRGSGKGAERECDISLNRTEKVESNSANRCELIVGDL
jgi:hypothetical protein